MLLLLLLLVPAPVRQNRPGGFLAISDKDQELQEALVPSEEVGLLRRQVTSSGTRSVVVLVGKLVPKRVCRRR